MLFSTLTLRVLTLARDLIHHAEIVNPFLSPLPRHTMTSPLLAIAQKTRQASLALARVDSALKDQVLLAMAQSLSAHEDAILTANQADCDKASAQEMEPAFLDRLRLDKSRLALMAEAITEIAALPDPVGEITESWRRPNGLLISKRRIPLGTIGIIYEARPNVTSDAAALCFKSGNAVLLKGGSSALESNRAIHHALAHALAQSALPHAAKHAIGFVDSTERQSVKEMLGLSDYLDLVIPRGGKSLIQFVHQHARVPVIKHDEGICHIVIEGSATASDVQAIVLNAKTQRPSTCNAMETLLLLQNAVSPHLDPLLRALHHAQVTLHLDPTALARAHALGLHDRVHPAGEDAFGQEFLRNELALRVVNDLDEAIAHIDRHGSRHTESLLTQNLALRTQFLDQVNSSVVMINASTRLSDGNQLGLGAEIGISTTRMHAYGPMGLRELTATKFVVEGEGQIRP